MGTFTFAYCGSVCYTNQISLYNTTSFVMMMLVQTLLEVNAQNVASNFGIFFLMSTMTIVFMYYNILPLEGKSFDQLKKLYFAEEPRQ